MPVNKVTEEKRMTKFEAYAEKVHALREKRRNEELNLQLAIGLRTRTREEVVAELLGELTVVVGVSDLLCAQQEGVRRELLA